METEEHIDLPLDIEHTLSSWYSLAYRIPIAK